MIRIRSGRGVGDSLYLRPIVDYLIGDGSRVTALSDYPAIFEGSGATVEPFTRASHSLVAHYTHTMHDQSRTQYADMLRSAKIAADVPLRFGWTAKNRRLVDGLRAQACGRPLILVHGGREPFQRLTNDGFGLDLMPKREALVSVLGALADCYTVRIGSAKHLYPLPVDVDLNGGTSISDLLDLSSICDGVVAQCSFAIPLAEVFGKPLLAIWAAKGLVSATAYLRLITPRKVLHNDTSSYVMDNWSRSQIEPSARGLLNVKEMACAL